MGAPAVASAAWEAPRRYSSDFMMRLIRCDHLKPVAFSTLALPRSEASGVEMILVRFGYVAVLPELSLELHPIPAQCLATKRARLTASGPAHDAVRTSRRQLPILDRFAGFLAQGAIVHL